MYAPIISVYYRLNVDRYYDEVSNIYIYAIASLHFLVVPSIVIDGLNEICRFCLRNGRFVKDKNCSNQSVKN